MSKATPKRRLADIRFLTVNEVADVLKVSMATVWRLKHDGSLAFYKIGGSIRFDERDVMRFVDDGLGGKSNGE